MTHALARFATVFLVALLAACSGAPMTGSKSVEYVFYDYNSAVRWSEFETAWTFVDPAVRDEKPFSDDALLDAVDRQRWCQRLRRLPQRLARHKRHRDDLHLRLFVLRHDLHTRRRRLRRSRQHITTSIRHRTDKQLPGPACQASHHRLDSPSAGKLIRHRHWNRP